MKIDLEYKELELIVRTYQTNHTADDKKDEGTEHRNMEVLKTEFTHKYLI